MRLQPTFLMAAMLMSAAALTLATMNRAQHGVGPVRPFELPTDKLVIGSTRGKIRLFIHDDGEPTLTLADNSDRVRVVLRPSGLAFYNSYGVVVLALDALEQSHAGLRIRTPSDREAVSKKSIFLGSMTDGQSLLSLRAGSSVWLSVDGDSVELRLSGIAEEKAVGPGVRVSRDERGVVITDHDGNTLWHSK